MTGPKQTSHLQTSMKAQTLLILDRPFLECEIHPQAPEQPSNHKELTSFDKTFCIVHQASLQALQYYMMDVSRS